MHILAIVSQATPRQHASDAGMAFTQDTQEAGSAGPRIELERLLAGAGCQQSEARLRGNHKAWPSAGAEARELTFLTHCGEEADLCTAARVVSEDAWMGGLLGERTLTFIGTVVFTTFSS